MLSVRELLRRRKATGSQRFKRKDPYHLALVVECGGARSVVAGGMVAVLEEYGLADCFDTIHGSSAGACTGAYFLAGQAAMGQRIFYEDLYKKKFMSFTRLLARRPVVAVDRIAELIMEGTKPLNTNIIVTQPHVLHVTTTHAQSGQACIFSTFRSHREMIDVLKATLTIPGPWMKGMEIDGGLHVDGGICAPIPMASAAMVGATHVLVAANRLEERYDVEVQEFRYRLERLMLFLLFGHGVREAFLRGRENIGTLQKKWQGGCEIDFLLRPNGSTHIGTFTKDRGLLRKAQAEAHEVARRYLQTVFKTKEG